MGPSFEYLDKDPADLYFTWAQTFDDPETFALWNDIKGHGLLVWPVKTSVGKVFLPGLVKWRIPKFEHTLLRESEGNEETFALLTTMPCVEVEILKEDYGFCPVAEYVPWSFTAANVNTLNFCEATASLYDSTEPFNTFVPSWQIVRLPKDIYDKWARSFLVLVNDMNVLTYDYQYWLEAGCAAVCHETSPCITQQEETAGLRCTGDQMDIEMDRWTNDFFQHGFVRQLTQKIEFDLFEQSTLFQQTWEYASNRFRRGWSNALWNSQHHPDKETQLWFRSLVSQHSPFLA